MPDEAEFEAEMMKLYYEQEALDKRANELKQRHGACDVEDYDLLTKDGETVKLSGQFGEHDTMVLVHNMGSSCPYCTLWADSFEAVYKHVNSGVPGVDKKAAFILTSPDEPAKLKAFAAARGWSFPCFSIHGGKLAHDLGYANEKDQYGPGCSILKLADGEITRVSRDHFGPGDKYCGIFGFLGLIPG